MWIILTLIDYGILFSILVVISFHLLQMLWMTCWTQSPTLVYKVTFLMKMSNKQNCILFSTSFSLSNGPLIFCLIYLESFNVHGYLLPTSINIMIIQTTKGTCASSFIYLMWIFTMFIIIKSNLIKGKFIPWTFTIVAFLRRWIWWGSGSPLNTSNEFND